MLLEILMKCSCIISHELPHPARRFRGIQIVIITNVVVVSSGGINWVDCMFLRLPFMVWPTGSRRNVLSDMCAQRRIKLVSASFQSDGNIFRRTAKKSLFRMLGCVA